MLSNRSIFLINITGSDETIFSGLASNEYRSISEHLKIDSCNEPKSALGTLLCKVSIAKVINVGKIIEYLLVFTRTV